MSSLQAHYKSNNCHLVTNHFVYKGGIKLKITAQQTKEHINLHLKTQTFIMNFSLAKQVTVLYTNLFM